MSTEPILPRPEDSTRDYDEPKLSSRIALAEHFLTNDYLSQRQYDWWKGYKAICEIGISGENEIIRNQAKTVTRVMDILNHREPFIVGPQCSSTQDMQDVIRVNRTMTYRTRYRDYLPQTPKVMAEPREYAPTHDPKRYPLIWARTKWSRLGVAILNESLRFEHALKCRLSYAAHFRPTTRAVWLCCEELGFHQAYALLSAAEYKRRDVNTVYQTIDEMLLGPANRLALTLYADLTDLDCADFESEEVRETVRACIKAKIETCFDIEGDEDEPRYWLPTESFKAREGVAFPLSSFSQPEKTDRVPEPQRPIEVLGVPTPGVPGSLAAAARTRRLSAAQSMARKAQVVLGKAGLQKSFKSIRYFNRDLDEELCAMGLMGEEISDVDDTILAARFSHRIVDVKEKARVVKAPMGEESVEWDFSEGEETADAEGYEGEDEWELVSES